jgi:hypothetical protein
MVEILENEFKSLVWGMINDLKVNSNKHVNEVLKSSHDLNE